MKFFYAVPRINTRARSIDAESTAAELVWSLAGLAGAVVTTVVLLLVPPAALLVAVELVVPEFCSAAEQLLPSGATITNTLEPARRVQEQYGRACTQVGSHRQLAHM